MTGNLPARLDRSAEVTDYLKGQMPVPKEKAGLPGFNTHPAGHGQADAADIQIARQLNWLVWIMLGLAAALIGLLGFIAILALQNGDNSQLLATNQELAETVKDLVTELREERAEERPQESKLSGFMVVSIMLGLAGALISYGLARSFGLGLYAIAAMIGGLYYIGAI